LKAIKKKKKLAILQTKTHDNAIVADIEDLRKALQIEQWNLLSLS